MLSKAFCSAILMFGVAGVASQAQAGLINDPTIGVCTSVGCSSTVLSASFGPFGGVAGTWTEQIVVGAAKCLRIQVTQQTYDLEMTVIAPNGTVYQNDDTTVADKRPRLKINNTPVAGSYTVVIGQTSGSPVVQNFLVAFGVYALGNMNCTSPF
jgi:hypothetical protein